MAISSFRVGLQLMQHLPPFLCVESSIGVIPTPVTYEVIFPQQPSGQEAPVQMAWGSCIRDLVPDSQGCKPLVAVCGLWHLAYVLIIRRVSFVHRYVRILAWRQK